MTLEFISKNGINEKRIILPRDSFNGEIIVYRLDTDKREISFFYTKRQEELNRLCTWHVPGRAREMKFNIFDKNGCYVPIPRFYDREGNVLKIGNR